MIGAGPPHLRFQQPPVIQNVLLQRRTLGTQRAAIDGMVRIALHVDHRRGHVLAPSPRVWMMTPQLTEQ